MTGTYVLWKQGGKRSSHPFTYTKVEAERIAKKDKSSVFLNLVTRRLTKCKK